MHDATSQNTNRLLHGASGLTMIRCTPNPREKGAM